MFYIYFFAINEINLYLKFFKILNKMDSENELKNLENKAQERLENLNERLDDFSQKYNDISFETKSKSKKSTKINFNFNLKSFGFISLFVCILSFIIYHILNKVEPDFIKEKNNDRYEVSSLKLCTYSFVLSIFIVIFLYFGYYVYKNFRT